MPEFTTKCYDCGSEEDTMLIERVISGGKELYDGSFRSGEVVQTTYLCAKCILETEEVLLK